MFKKILMQASSLRTKMLLAMAIGLGLLFALFFFFARVSILEGYTVLENEKTEIKLERAKNLIQHEAGLLERNAVDNAHWDDFYDYMVEKDPAFIKSTFGGNILKNLNINAIFVVNSDGESIFQKSIDFKTGQSRRVPEQIAQALRKNGSLTDPSKKVISGLFWTPQYFCIISSVDILDTEESKPSRGRLVLIKILDDKAMQEIEKIVDGKILIQAFRDDEIAVISPSLLQNKNAVKPVNDDQIAGYAPIKSINQDVKLILSVIADRKIFAQGKSSLNLLYWSFALLALLLAAYSWLFDKLVLAPLFHLNNIVRQIGESTSQSGRIKTLASNDEINSLANGINGMLENLDKTKQDLQLEKERAQVTLTSIAEAVITSNVNGEVLYMNAAAERLTGIESSFATGKSLQNLFDLMTADKTTKVSSEWLTNPSSIVDEVMLMREDGQEFILSKSASQLHDDKGKVFGTVTVLHDVTILRMMSNQLSQQARFDALTGLPNRYEFDRKAQLAIQDTLSTSQTHCVAFIDLDKFKLVNDTCGHMAGDIFLKQLSLHMQHKLRTTDTLARLGGDEFALLLMGCNLVKANDILHDLLKAIQDFRFEYDSKIFKVGASIGLTEISPRKKLSLSELLAIADSACYGAKRDGGNCVHEYQANDNNMQEQSNLLSWVSRINIGLENNQFVLFNQPLQSLKSGEAHGELLIRMKGDDGMLFPPSTFLPAAERYRLMPQIDRWVVNEALSIIARKGSDFSTLCAINLSGQSLSQDGFLDYVLEKIDQHQINPLRLCFEITETAVISNLEKAQHFMRSLRAIGCRFSLDDFGSGLSSFAYLKNLEVDFLKIDGMFIKNIASSKIDRAMVESINNVGHVMGLHTIGEFAENQEIIDILKEIGVDYAQGYGVAMPTLFE